ncbi:MTERF4, partial [Symbiodinium sp. CCMP2456]
MQLTTVQVAKSIARFPSVLGYSIEANLKPKVQWIKGIGLSQSQVAKVIAVFPSVLGYSIEENLKPTADWIKGLGLSQSQVAKVISSHPQVLGLSVEANLKPTVEWIKGLGLSQSHVAKVILKRPQALGLSIEANLKPTVEWVKGLGLSQSQVSKVILQRPSVLGLSIEANLKPTVEWMKGLGMSQCQVGKLIAAFPPVFGRRIDTNLSAKHRLLQDFFPGVEAAELLAQSPRLWSYRYARLEHRLSVLKSHNDLSKLAGAMTLPLDGASPLHLAAQLGKPEPVLWSSLVVGGFLTCGLEDPRPLSAKQISFGSLPPTSKMQHPSWRRWLRRGGLVHRPCANLPRFTFGAALTESTPPAWWLKGRPRNVFRSRAEVELLSQLAVLLMPDEPIAEAFRDFPVQRCKGWGSSRLCPDFAAHGVLKRAGAALFIEYDGYYRHMEPAGLNRDVRKTSALLKFAPVGSIVLRIAHKERQWKDNSVQVLVDCWQSEHVPSLHKTVRQVVASLLQSCRAELVPGLVSQLEARAQMQIDRQAQTFAVDAELVGSASRSSGLAVEEFLQTEMQLTPVQVARSIARFPSVLGLSIEARLLPTVGWIKGLGLSQSQVAKVIASFPQVLGYNIEANLKPTVEWIKGLGLRQSQVAKMITRCPQVLSYSIEANLKPTVEWIKGLGLSQSQVAKVISSYPQVLGLSIESNLERTVEWIQGLGLSQSQVAKVIATFPPVLGLSIEANLKPAVEWFKGLGLSQSQVAKVIATFPQVLGLSIEANLKPTVEWIKGLGLSQSQVAKVILRRPQVLGMSIEGNLKPT